MLTNIGHPHDYNFINQIKSPRLLKRSLLRVYQQEYKSLGRRKANLSHLARIAKIKEISNGLRLTTKDYEIKDQAKFHVNTLNSLLTHGMDEAAWHIQSCGLPFPWRVAEREANSNGGYVSCDGPTAKRLTNDKWMIRALRKEIRRRIESVALDQGVIDKKLERYSSDQTVLIHEQQRDLTWSSKLVHPVKRLF